MDIYEAMPLESARIAELTQRTNRCTNGKRYSVADIRQSMERLDVHLYSVHLKDRFSDLGLIGAMEIVEGRLSLLSLFCGALGRELFEALERSGRTLEEHAPGIYYVRGNVLFDTQIVVTSRLS